MADSGLDVLFDVRNALAIGNYQGCVAEAQKLSPSGDEEREERDALMYRAMVAQGKYAVVKGDVTSDSPSSLQAVRRMASYFHKKADRASCVEEIKALAEDGISMANPTVALCSATILWQEGSTDEALRCLHAASASDSVECMALATQILLGMNRVDAARKELKKMQGLDEDATVTQLALAWVSLAVGGEKLQEAFYIYQELAEKYVGTTLLLNGQAAALIAQGKYDEADTCLQAALERDPNDVETLVNCIPVTQGMGKGPEVVQRYLNQLQDSAASHLFVANMNKADADFDEFAGRYGIGK